MLKLIYTRKRDPHQYVTLYGCPASIRDLYWQLTRNYRAVDGTEIGEINVMDMNGTPVPLTGPSSLMSTPDSFSLPECTLER